MTDRERLKEKIDYLQKVFMEDDDYDYFNEFLADRLLADKDIIVPPCKVGDYVRFKGLTSLWQVDAIHYYREGLPQITATDGNVTSAIADFETFEVVTKEEVEEKLKECEGNAKF